MLREPDWVMVVELDVVLVELDEVMNIGVDWPVLVDDHLKVQLINVEKPESQYW